MNIEQEVYRIIKQEAVKHTSREILDKVGSRLSQSDGIVLVELRKGKTITVHYPCSLPLAIYGMTIGKQSLVDTEISSMEITNGEVDDESTEGVNDDG